MIHVENLIKFHRICANNRRKSGGHSLSSFVLRQSFSRHTDGCLRHILLNVLVTLSNIHQSCPRKSLLAEVNFWKMLMKY